MGFGRGRIVVCAGFGLALGCSPPAATPAADIARAHRTIAEASELGARDDVRAWFELSLAAQELDRARALSAASDYDGAKSFARRATADAEVAAALAREVVVREAAEKAIERAGRLAAELARASASAAESSGSSP